MEKSIRLERIGTIRKNTFGSYMKVVEYENVLSIWVKFEQGNLVHTRWFDFIDGKVKNPFDKAVYNIGYFGVGKYKANINGKITPQYERWRGMIRRCYSEIALQKNPTYKGCIVCEEWHNYQNFAKWFDENYYEINGEKIELDKDILIKGNKLYSPDTCVFVPKIINTLFTKSNISRGEYPIGVSSYKKEKYLATCLTDKRHVNLGKYETMTEAFNAYKTYKENLIKKVADEYKDKIPARLYNAMLNYKVEITD